ncbi:glyoxylate/hydroxypyruvate reductase A [Pseudooceanicola antarcticus]|uniref:Glyoxylate/hydroxypyruvate reductase A n=1 Tax=Pseudooceanicola antarcticus TaxID=1247613 RepID=A0A285IIC9_9RHOB|nr:glyoxylate/hydroxypyruvate reductase A [Pseudooceanicola antarcticus]PJE29084.1 glyoxylate/hydroxypyruvate reductase A [Pseudooceanicola antarcticus]SNY46826.1 glyoxylate/hydroxypyruvate reductase A [Pseudooceanicola antarcticus]
MINVLFAATAERWTDYEAPLRAAFAARDLAVDLRTEFAPEEVDYIVYAPNSPLQDFTPYTRCKAVLNLWAGVEAIVGNETLTQPLARMVDHGLSRGMVEWVTGHVLRHHLHIDHFLAHQDGDWDGARMIPPLAEERPVTMLGLGELGSACAQALAGLGFPVTGWSRSQKDIPGITCLSGDAGLDEALSTAQILILLLPLTPETTDLLDARRLAQLPRGAVVINPGRGPMIVDQDLVAALDSGQLRHATLDVFRTEPLPAEHPFWSHPKVTVCPHIASETRPRTAAEVVAENVSRGEAGEPLKFLVDRARGY